MRYHYGMAQVIIRNLDDDVVAYFKRRAARDRTSLEHELRDLATRTARRSRERFDEVTTRIGEQTRGAGLDPTELIREDRDR